MRESATYQAILREGKAEGKIEEAKQTLLRLGRLKFGQPRAAIKSKIEAIADLVRLEQLTDHVLVVKQLGRINRGDLIDANNASTGDLTAPTMDIPTPARSRPDFRLPASREAFVRANRVIPGGVNSPARAFGAVGGEPPFMAHASGAYLYDIDGHKYIDYIGSWGPMILGHAHSQVRSAVVDALDLGSSFGAPRSGRSKSPRPLSRRFRRSRR